MCFLACSRDTVFSAFATGAFLDWLFRQQARELNLDQDMDIDYFCASYGWYVDSMRHFSIQRIDPN